MPGRSTPKWNKQQTALMEGEVMDILSHTHEALTIDQIEQRSFTLNGVSNQKMARILSHLIEMGMVVKAKSRSQNKMVYKSLAVFEEEGYEPA